MTTRRPRRIPPVLLTAVFGVLMWLVSTLTPSVDIPLPARAIVAVSLAAAGLAVTTLAVKGFREQRTSVNPLDLSPLRVRVS